MLKNYLKIAFRNLGKYKFISFINLFGLTVGLACCMLILTYILHETSYDRFNTKADRIYRVTRSFNNKEGIESLHLSSVAPPFGPLLQNDFPEIQKMTRMLPVGPLPFRYDDKIFNEQNVSFADNNLFSIFDIPIVEGDRTHPLSEPFSAMMTPATARKYFGDADPINKILRVNNQYDIKVTGIFTPLPSNSHFHVDVLLSFPTLNDSAVYGAKGLAENWGNNAFYTYLLFPEHYPVQRMEAQFPAFLDRHMNTQTGYGNGSTPHKLTKIFLQPLTDIHLRSHLDDELEPNGDINRVYVFSAIALFILLIACINYMNLSTARSALRAKEIGIRKVSGARRQELVMQFLCESVLLAYMAILLAGGLTVLAMPWIDSITGLQLSPDTILRTKVLIPLLVAPVVVGVLSGLYPAVFLSSFQPVKVLKGLF
ncbi:MAG TPA: ABC transporter permease, partial [Puia sp.]|nr:ABC transporter permease [Puia sp.]